MKKKILSILMVSIMVVAMLTGCSSTSSTTSSTSTATGSVYWLNFKPEADEALQSLAATYTEQTGVKVTVVTAASGEYESTLTSEMDKSNAPTLFVVGNTSSVDTWGDYCYDLTGTDVYNQLNTDAFTLYKENGEVASIGYCYECYGIIVNKTLLAQAGYSVDDITDFASLAAVAEDIHARAAELGFDAFTSSGMDSSSSWRFSGHLANMALYFESEDAGGWTETPATITGEYIEYFKNVWDLYINNSAYAATTLATAGYDAEAEFCNGEAVFYQNGSWEYSAISAYWDDDEITMIPIYCGSDIDSNMGLCSGTENCWAVNAKASEADIQATLDFMYWCVTSEEGLAVFMEQFGVIPYQAAPDSSNVFLTAANDYANAGCTTITWAFNYTPNVDEWRAGVVAAMNQYDAGSADWSVVETAFISGWATQYQAIQ